MEIRLFSTPQYLHLCTIKKQKENNLKYFLLTKFTDLKMEKTYQTLKEFYPYYLTEHRNATSRRLHFIGTALFIALLIYALLEAKWTLLMGVPLLGYGFAWVGHYFFERNKPATFKYPLFSLMSDFIMFWDILTGQIDRKLRDAIING